MRVTRVTQRRCAGDPQQVSQYLSCRLLQLAVPLKQRGDRAAAVRGGTPGYMKQTHPHHHHHTHSERVIGQRSGVVT